MLYILGSCNVLYRVASRIHVGKESLDVDDKRELLIGRTLVVECEGTHKISDCSSDTGCADRPWYSPKPSLSVIATKMDQCYVQNLRIVHVLMVYDI